MPAGDEKKHSCGWLSVLVRPKKVGKDLTGVPLRHRTAFLLYAAALFFIIHVDVGISSEAGIQVLFNSLFILISSLILAFPLLYFNAYFISLTGRWLSKKDRSGERALSVRESCAVSVYSAMPVMMVSVILSVFLLFGSDSPLIGAGFFIGNMWSVVVFVILLMHAQGFSVWKAIIHGILSLTLQTFVIFLTVVISTVTIFGVLFS